LRLERRLGGYPDLVDAVQGDPHTSSYNNGCFRSVPLVSPIGTGGLGGSGAATTGEERGCGEGISCAGFGSCPVFASLFSPPLFAAPQTPSRTKA
jgi:hypothetical protein